MNEQQRRLRRMARLEMDIDLRWWLVPLALALLVLAALLSWPQLSTRPDGRALHASPPPARAASVASVGSLSVAAAPSPSEEPAEDNHAPTF